MAWDLHLCRGDQELLPLGSMAEVDAAMQELLPGYEPGEDLWETDDFMVEIRMRPDEDPVMFIALTPHGDTQAVLPALFTLAERFQAELYSDAEPLTPESAAQQWQDFEQWRDRALGDGEEPGKREPQPAQRRRWWSLLGR